jgi:hypothetical protein
MRRQKKSHIAHSLGVSALVRQAKPSQSNTIKQASLYKTLRWPVNLFKKPVTGALTDRLAMAHLLHKKSLRHAVSVD